MILFPNKGYVLLTGTSAIDLSATPIAAITPLADTVIAAITHPSNLGGAFKYNGDAANLAGKTLTKGVHYPIPATAITLTSGSALGWLL